jgi:hypothetical protein
MESAALDHARARHSRLHKDVVAALAQIGAFALPALLPGYIARWYLSKIEAGWGWSAFSSLPMW